MQIVLAIAQLLQVAPARIYSPNGLRLRTAVACQSEDDVTAIGARRGLECETILS